MYYAFVSIGWLLCVAACRAPLAYLQAAHYRPWRPVSVAYAVGQSVVLVWAVAVACVWRLVWPQYNQWAVVAMYAPICLVICLYRRPRVRITARLVRLWCGAGVVYAVACAVVAAYDVLAPYWGLICAMGYLVVQVADSVLYPIESRRNARFIRAMSLRLARSNVQTVGITGSAGKTSVKQLLRSALGADCYVTPGNYNTPLGLALAVRAMPTEGISYFVAEMGAAKVGDIQALLSFVCPHIGVLTCVLPQHTARFGDVATIRREKAKVLQAAKWTVSGQGDIDADCVVGRDIWAENICLHTDGTSFDIVCGQRTSVWLPLCGRQCVDNALVAWAVARHIGVEGSTIVQRWAHMPRDPHRLCPATNAQGVVIVDDAYNCNIRGAQYALEYISLYGGRKIVATSGIDESDPALRLNEQLAAMLDKVADIVVIVGNRYRAQIQPHLHRAKVYEVPSTTACVPLYATLLHAGDVLLVMADYPM